MEIEQGKDILMRRAVKSYLGQNLTYCGDKKNWDECFTVDETELSIWFNTDDGNSHALTIDLQIDPNLV